MPTACERSVMPLRTSGEKDYGADKGSPRSHTIPVRVSPPDDERAQTASCSAYAFSRGGKPLDIKPLEKGEAVLNVALGAEGTNVRVVVGPQLKGAARSLAELFFRRGAIERPLRVDLNAGRLAVEIPIRIGQILCWIRGLCFVNGTVIRRTSLGGQTVDLPVCNATVEVCEVDPFRIILPEL